jgi:hypothetical protein
MLQHQPSILAFENPEPFGDAAPSMAPSPLITLPIENHADIEYELRSVIFIGGYHFAVRIISRDGSIWKYDGQQRNGNLEREEITVHSDI